MTIVVRDSVANVVVPLVPALVGEWSIGLDVWMLAVVLEESLAANFGAGQGVEVELHVAISL